jgi:hypothetical protein
MLFSPYAENQANITEDESKRQAILECGDLSRPLADRDWSRGA